MTPARLLPLIALVLAACVTSVASDPGVQIIPGGIEPGRQPDGNTVVLDGRDGLIVFDTGRHRWHVDKIIAHARTRGRPVAAIINSHWHLDHISGNIALREVWPQAQVYSHGAALDEALGGFLARGAEANRARANDASLSNIAREEARADLATVAAGAKLHPDISIKASQTMTIAGRKLDVRVAKAASAGDIWIYDPASRHVLAGDLVTLPAPFLDTACPTNWSAALGEVMATPFETLVPGHGRVMNRADLAAYRAGFDGLVACAASRAEAGACAKGWVEAAAPLLQKESEKGAAEAYARYYVQNALRKPEARPAWCTG